MTTQQSTSKTNQKIIDLINSIELYSDQLSLTKFSKKEIEYNVAHEMDAELMKYIREPETLEKTLKNSQQKALPYTGEESEWVLFSLKLKSTGQYIGLVCFRYESIENDTVEIGWRIGHEFHGQGLATQGAELLMGFIKEKIKPHKVVAYCVTDNSASSNIMRKLGMQQEAHLRQYSKIGKKWYDEAIYGILLN